jgi:hypothetical protein
MSQTRSVVSEDRIGCGSNRPGHDPHPIQVLQIAPQRPHHAVEDLDITGATSVRLRVDGDWQSLRNHHTDRVLAAWQSRTGTAWWVPAARLLRIEHKGGHPCFDLASDGRYEPCLPAAPAPPHASDPARQTDPLGRQQRS